MKLQAKGRILKLIQELKPGDSFLCESPSKVCTHYAGLYHVKIETRRIITIDPKTLESKKVTKVTIL